MPSYDRALWTLRPWLDSWAGIGHLVVGMHRQGFDLQLTQYDERGWRTTFYVAGMEALTHIRHWNGVGTDAMAGCSRSSVGGVTAGTLTSGASRLLSNGAYPGPGALSS